MESHEQSENKRKIAKNSKIFMVAIVLGVLLGAIVTLLVLDVMKLRKPIVVHVEGNNTEASQGAKDTVVKYVVHRYEERALLYDDQLTPLDSIAQDTVYQENLSEDLTMEDADYTVENDAVVTPHILGRHTQKVAYLDADKREIPTPENSLSTVQILYFDTPIKNKYSYLFSGNVLKIKGLPSEQSRIVHYRNNFYLIQNHRVYLITPNSQFERMTETHSLTF